VATAVNLTANKIQQSVRSAEPRRHANWEILQGVLRGCKAASFMRLPVACKWNKTDGSRLTERGENSEGTAARALM